MDTTRLISTVAIWAAAAAIFLGGFVRISWSGWAGGLPWALGVVGLFLGAGYATKWVWSSGKRADDNVSDREDT